jgi:hypothetical protein
MLPELLQEYEDQKSAEAQFVKDLDRMDMVQQAFEYEQLEHRPGTLQEFFDSTRGSALFFSTFVVCVCVFLCFVVVVVVLTFKF